MNRPQLCAEDFFELQEQHAILKPFRRVALDLQSRASEGRNGSIWETLPSFDGLLEATEGRKDEVNAQRTKTIEMLSSIQDMTPEQQAEAWRPVAQACSLNNLWMVMDKYYKLTDDCPLIYSWQHSFIHNEVFNTSRFTGTSLIFRSIFSLISRSVRPTGERNILLLIRPICLPAP